MSQVIRPYIPYQGPIYEGIHEGKKIKIKGQVPYGADRFTVNLMTRLDTDCDRPFHISVRFKMNTAVRNTYYLNSWGSEEKSGPFPFAMGSKFTMVITVERDSYKISVNGQHCWDYAHRLPFTRVNSLMIDGDVSIERIEFINRTPPRAVTPSVPVNVISSGGALPCVFPIHGGIRPGMSIYISGRPTSGNPQKFTFNIQKGAATYPPPDIAFHFDVRFFNYSIVRNSRVNDVWYSEETMITHFPFQPGCNFDVVIRVQSDMYVVMVNGQQFVTFRHRLNPFSQFNVLSVENDVVVTSIRYT